MPDIEPIVLANGLPMPRRGFGTAPMLGDEAADAAATAIADGYRLVYTAEN